MEKRGHLLKSDGGVEMELVFWGILGAGTCRCDRHKKIGDRGVECREWKLSWHLQRSWHLQVDVVSELPAMGDNESLRTGRQARQSRGNPSPALLVLVE